MVRSRSRHRSNPRGVALLAALLVIGPALGLAACSSSGGDSDPGESGPTTEASSPSSSRPKPPPRTPGVDPFPVAMASAGLTGAEVCDRSREGVTTALGSAGTATPDPTLSKCAFLRGGITYTVTVFPFDAYELAKDNAYQVSDGDIEVTISRRKATWFAGPGVAASRMMVQMSDLASLLIERNGDGGAETQRAEMTAIAEAILPGFEAIRPPPLTAPSVPAAVEPASSVTSTTVASTTVTV